MEKIFTARSCENFFVVVFFFLRIFFLQPFYAVKCNDEPTLLRTLALLGCGSDCASAREIELVASMNIVDPKTRIIFAHTIKMK